MWYFLLYLRLYQTSETSQIPSKSREISTINSKELPATWGPWFGATIFSKRRNHWPPLNYNCQLKDGSSKYIRTFVVFRVIKSFYEISFFENCSKKKKKNKKLKKKEKRKNQNHIILQTNFSLQFYIYTYINT